MKKLALIIVSLITLLNANAQTSPIVYDTGVGISDHMHINYHPSQSVSDILKKLKRRTSRKLQQEFPKLKKKYCGRHFRGIGNGC